MSVKSTLKLILPTLKLILPTLKLILSTLKLILPTLKLILPTLKLILPTLKLAKRKEKITKWHQEASVRITCLQTINILRTIPESDHSKSVKFRRRQRHWFTIWRASPILPREASRRREASGGVRIVQTGLRKLGFCTCSSYNYHKPHISCKYR